MENLINDNYKELQKKNIKIFQFPGGEINDLNYSSGQFFDIFYINRFIYRALTLSGSSGSPILYYYNSKFIIFGIHKGSGKNKYFGKIEINLTEEKYINYGHFIYPIIDSLRKNNDKFIKTKEFTAEIFNNEQKGALLIKNNEKKIYDKLYIGKLSYFKPNGEGIFYKINYKEQNEELNE